MQNTQLRTHCQRREHFSHGKGLSCVGLSWVGWVMCRGSWVEGSWVKGSWVGGHG